MKVTLSGIGGDEIFGGYPRYLGAFWQERYRKLPLFFRKGVSRLAPLVPEQYASRNVGRWIKEFISFPQDSPETQYRRWVESFSPKDKADLYAPYLRDRLCAAAPPDLLREKLEELNAGALVDRAMRLDLGAYLVDDLLYMGDRMSMAHSLELRVPLCDLLLVEKLSSLGWDDKLTPFRLKMLLKRVAGSVAVPPKITERKKQGFMIPVAPWLRKQLAPMLREYLSPDRVSRQGLFRPEPIERMVASHIDGTAHHTDKLWALLVLQLWLESHQR